MQALSQNVAAGVIPKSKSELAEKLQCMELDTHSGEPELEWSEKRE